jgi:hypothetical protein
MKFVVICLTAFAIASLFCARDILIEREKGQNIRDAIRLYQMARPLLQRQQPSIEIPSGIKT